MKNPVLAPLFICISFLLNLGCQETCPEPASTISKTEWTLHYFEGSAGNDMYYAPPTFIKSGKAYFPANLFKQGFWFTEYTIPIPEEINLDLDNDNIKLVANMKNPAGDGRANELDLKIDYSSGTDVRASWQKGTDPSFCTIYVGSQFINNISEQLTDPTFYAEYAISLSGNQVTTWKNGSVLKTFAYTGTTGTVESISVSARGYGEIDWVKLYKGTKLIMTEDFNTDGKTTAVWNLP